MLHDWADIIVSLLINERYPFPIPLQQSIPLLTVQHLLPPASMLALLSSCDESVWFINQEKKIGITGEALCWANEIDLSMKVWWIWKWGRSEIRKIKNSPPPLPLHQSARFVQLLVQHIPQQVDATGDSSAKNGLKICREWELDPCVLYTDDTEMQDVFTVRVWSGLDSFWAVQCWHKRFPSSTAVQAQLLCIQTAKAIKKTNVDNSTVIFCVCVTNTVRLLLQTPGTSTNCWVLKIADSAKGKRYIRKDAKCNPWKQKKNTV